MKIIGYVLMERTSYNQTFVKLEFNLKGEYLRWLKFMEEFESLDLNDLPDFRLDYLIEKWYPEEGKDICYDFGLIDNHGEYVNYMYSKDFFIETHDGLYKKLATNSLDQLEYSKQDLDIAYRTIIPKALESYTSYILGLNPTLDGLIQFGKLSDLHKFFPSLYSSLDLILKVVDTFLAEGYEVIKNFEGWFVKVF